MQAYTSCIHNNPLICFIKVETPPQILSANISFINVEPVKTLILQYLARYQAAAEADAVFLGVAAWEKVESLVALGD